MIIKQLFSNLAILSSLLFLYIQLTNTSPLKRSSSLNRKLVMGISGGLFSNILMQYSMQIGNTIIDLRHVPVILVAYYGGSIPALIAMVMVIIGRFIIGINTSSYLAVILICTITAAAIYISKRKLPKKTKILLILTFSNVIFSVLVSYLLKDPSTLLFLLPTYWIISYSAGFISFYIVEYLRRSQALFDRYKSESATDGLTGLNNVRKFDEIFNDLLRTIPNNNEKLSLLYLDIDFFKKVNDTYGHQNGDIILKDLGKILQESVRSFDIVSRNGGEEFTVILLDCPVDRAKEISEKIRKAVEDHEFTLTDGQIIHITISIGIACFNDTTDDVTSLIEDADSALYMAKKTGRNRVCVSENIKAVKITY
ncbi:GGDEF domain-containing protein [Bacillus sp. SG-1]|uniref:GGDEF domain-containing protein n=1 Tax=Bacillus sp. SG-1 TaxID=161544 RepID=UPI0005C70699|nr:diguanylate cyclase [Bacillus sp. SG-1]